MPTSSQRYNAAEKLKDAGQLAEAAQMVEELLVDDPTYVLGHMMLGKIYVDLGKYDDAIAHNKRAVELEPNEPLNHSALSVSYQRAWEGTRDPRYIQMAEDSLARSHKLHGG
ncbi:MAG: tetratricopeptide repeat protein [Pirellulaceae bacterium]|nr:tetratricopeptide repeat protein [Pirellulaceae bacterium]